MKKLFILFLVPVIAMAVNYDADDRVEAFEAFDHLDFTAYNAESLTQLDPVLVEKAINATTAMIRSSKLVEQEDGSILIKGSKLSRFRFYSTKKYLCEDVRFLDQQSSATCTGALVGPQHVLTAGHCVENMDDCNNYRWVFDYKYNPGFEDILVTENDVYQCATILGREVNNGSNIDWAIVKLDRPVVGRQTLGVRTRTMQKYLENGVEKTSKLERRTPLFLVGFSFGTPMKFANNGQVRGRGLANSFTSNVDHNFGNSGGPVINAKTGLIEGIVGSLGLGVYGLVNGGVDETGKACLVPKEVESKKYSDSSSIFLQSNRTNYSGILSILRSEGIL